MYECPYCKQQAFDITVEIGGAVGGATNATFSSLDEWLALLMRVRFTYAQVECVSCGYKPVEMMPSNVAVFKGTNDGA